MPEQLSIRTATNADQERVRDFLSLVLAELGFQLDPDSTDADLEDIERSYRGGTFELLLNGRGQLIGTVGVARLDHERCELRKMYLSREWRGQGLGKRLLKIAIGRARELGFKRIELETASSLETAGHLYASFGFQPFAPEHLSGRCDTAYYLDLSVPTCTSPCTQC